MASPDLYLPSQGPADPALVGGKAANLGRLQALGFPVPAWAVITVPAVASRLDDEAFHREVEAAALREGWSRLAVRSSAVGEDGRRHSYAGMFTSLLWVERDDLWPAARRVAQSARAERVLSYCRRHGLEPPRMAILLQPMVEAVAAGVAFTRDPVSPRAGEVILAAVSGTAEALVAGEVEGETWRVGESGPQCETPPQVLSVADATRIAEMALAVERALGEPQDIEWVLDATGELLLLQARPITAQAVAPPANGPRRVWDNSNIIESYPGVTLPLTFSFARRVYEGAYAQFCRAMGVEGSVIEAHRGAMAAMLGHLNGRVYYNLLSWYEVLSLLPGYGVNRAFMERMMGVRSRLENPPAPPYQAGRLHDTLRLLRMLGRLVRWHHRLPGEAPRFHAYVDRILRETPAAAVATMAPAELAALFRRLERDLLGHWEVPLVNDFFTMVWGGVLARLAERWLPESAPILVPSLMAGERDMVSAAPAREARAMARRLKERGETDPRAVPAMEVSAFLERYGDRCPGELKLETPTEELAPQLLLAAVRAALDEDEPAEIGGEDPRRLQAEAEVRSRLTGLRRRLFFWVLKQARASGRRRENLRLERTRVFGLARRVFRALGVHMTSQGVLPSSDGIHYLTVEEVLEWVDRTGDSGPTLSAVAARRHVEFEAYRAMLPLPDRFEAIGDALPPTAAPAPTGMGSEATVLRGMACGAGVGRGCAVVLREPREAADLRGKVLVAERTDPGWTLLFPGIAGLAVQRGNLLSHSAIVARELGIPCVVGVAELLTHVHDGEWLEVDGAAGEVRRLGSAPP